MYSNSDISSNDLLTRVTEFDARINLDEVARVSNIVSVFRQHSRLIIDVINQFIQRSLSLFSIPIPLSFRCLKEI